MIIDTHHHFWHYNTKDYGWINDDMPILRRNFLPEDLQKEIIQAGVDGVISVQARQCIEETEWLLQLANENDFIKGIVGWLPLSDRNIESYLETYSHNTNLKSIRHVLQDEADEKYMLHKDFNEGIKALKQYGFVYDILIFEKHLPQTIEFVDLHPNQVFILNHIAKPRIKDTILSPWRENITELARRENVYCKISGMVTEADLKHWTEEQLQPYMEIVLKAFGTNRLLFGSDWPVCLVACEYRRWITIVRDFLSALSMDEQDNIFTNNPLRAYNLTI